MPLRTQLFEMLPWRGGVNTAVDPSMIGKNQLIVYDNAIMDTNDSKKKREGINHNWDSNTSAAQSIIGIIDFWYEETAGETKKHRLFTVTDDKTFQIFQTSDGSATSIVDSGTVYADAITEANFEILNNKLMIAVDGDANVIKVFDPQSSLTQVTNLSGTPPRASILRRHIGRLWCNDKTNPDRLHYCTTGDPTEWNGTGDSGAIDIGIGDGDPEGITAIFPTFKGDLYIAKKTKLYRLTGWHPELFQIQNISETIGAVSHGTADNIGINDIFWCSDKGVHSLVNTSSYGDIEESYISADIQKTFNDDFSFSRLNYMRATYLSTINSYILATTDTSFSSGQNNALWIYHLPTKSWHRWKTINAASLCISTDTDKKRMYFGTNLKRVAKSMTGVSQDTSSAGVDTAIDFRLRTGKMAVDDKPYNVKGFKKFALYYRPVGAHSITVNIKVDKLPWQTLTFSGSEPGDVLGSTFILGTSTLGADLPMEPNALGIEDYGRLIEIEIIQEATGQDVEIQGFAIEYESAGTSQETYLTSGT